MYIIKVYNEQGFYGYYAEHPEQPELPFYSDNMFDAIKYTSAAQAQEIADEITYNSDFECVVLPL